MQIKNRQQMLTILTLTAIGLLVLDKVVSPPLTRMWNNRSAQIATLKSRCTRETSSGTVKTPCAAAGRKYNPARSRTRQTAAEQQLLAG